MKATFLLKDQHQQVRQLFSKLERTDDVREREALREQIAEALVGHSAIEKELFYPALEPTDMIDESYEEHAVVEWCLQRLLATKATDDAFRPRVKVLKEIVEHHLDEEEEILLPKAERSLGMAQLDQLGDKMQARFEQIEDEGYEDVLALSLGVEKRSLRKPHPTILGRGAPKRGRAAAKRAGTRGTTAKRATGKRATTAKRAATRGPAKRSPATRGTAKRAPSAATKRTSTTQRPRKQAGAKTSARGRKSRASSR